jgi:hypothetical protein
VATLAEARAAVARGTRTNELRAYAIREAGRVARQYGLDPARFANTFVALITQESGWNPQAYNPSGASGIAQIMPQYHPGVDPWNPEQSLSYAAEYFGSLVKRYGGDYLRGAAAYNYGPGNVDRLAGLDNQSFYRNLPEETQLYVRNVAGYQPVRPPGTGGGMRPKERMLPRGGFNVPGPDDDLEDGEGPYVPVYPPGGYGPPQTFSENDPRLAQAVGDAWYRYLTGTATAEDIGLLLQTNQLNPSDVRSDYGGSDDGTAWGRLALDREAFEEQRRQNEFDRFVDVITTQQAAQQMADARRATVQDRLVEAAPNLTMGREFYGGFEPFGAYSAVANFAGVPFMPRSTAAAQLPLSTDMGPAPVVQDPLLAAILERL